MPASLQLPEVDQVEILTVLHNSLDLLMAGSETARRVPLDGTVGEGRSILLAEHGFSILVTVVKGGQREKFLLDAGLTKETSFTTWTSLRYGRVTSTQSCSVMVTPIMWPG